MKITIATTAVARQKFVLITKDDFANPKETKESAKAALT